MKTKFYLKNLSVKILRDRNNIFFILLLVISTIMLIGSMTFKNNIDYYIEENINKNIKFRTIQVSNKKDKSDFGKNELLNIEHVQDVYNSLYGTFSIDSDFASEKLNGKITPMYLPKSTTIHSLVGSKFDENDKEVAIIPRNFYPDSSVYNFKIDEKNIIDGESLIGKKFTVTYYTKKFENMRVIDDKKITKTFTIIGVYDNKEMMNFNNEIFIPEKDLNEISRARTPQNDNPDIIISQFDDYGFNVVVDNLQNIENVTETIYKHNFLNVDSKTEIDKTTVDQIKFSCYIISTTSIIVIILIIFLYIKKKAINESTFIGIYRASGYTKKDIKTLYIFETLITCICTYILGAILSIVMCFIFKNTIFRAITYVGYDIKIYLMDFVISFIIIVLVSLISSIYIINKKLKCSIIDLIESRE